MGSRAWDAGGKNRTHTCDINWMLCDAASRGKVGEIKRLIAAGANPNAYEGTCGVTPLHLAAIHGRAAVITALLKAGAHVNGTNSYGFTPLLYTGASDYTAALDVLIAAGADVNHANEEGVTALHRASIWGYFNTACKLLEAGARVDVRTSDGKLPVDLVGTCVL